MREAKTNDSYDENDFINPSGIISVFSGNLLQSTDACLWQPVTQNRSAARTRHRSVETPSLNLGGLHQFKKFGLSYNAIVHKAAKIPDLVSDLHS